MPRHRDCQSASRFRISWKDDSKIRAKCLPTKLFLADHQEVSTKLSTVRHARAGKKAEPQQRRELQQRVGHPFGRFEKNNRDQCHYFL